MNNLNILICHNCTLTLTAYEAGKYIGLLNHWGGSVKKAGNPLCVKCYYDELNKKTIAVKMVGNAGVNAPAKDKAV